MSRINNELDKLPSEGFKVFKDKTPKRSGNAKNKTKLQGNTINADYDYATRLNQGYSKKAPRGMTEPTVDYLRKLVKRIFKG